MTQRPKIFDSEFWAESPSETEETRMLDQGNPSIASILTGLLTWSRNYNEAYRWGCGTTLEDGSMYVEGLEALRAAAATADNKREAFESLAKLTAQLKESMTGVPEGNACHCTHDALAVEKLGNWRLGSAIRAKCVSLNHHIGWFNRPKVLAAGFGSRVNPRWVVEELAVILGAFYWKNQYGEGYKMRRKDGSTRDLPTVKDMVKELEADEPNYHPKPGMEAWRSWRHNQLRNRTDLEPTSDQSLMDRVWRHTDNYEQDVPFAEDGTFILEDREAREQVVKLLVIKPDAYVVHRGDPIYQGVSTKFQDIGHEIRWINGKPCEGQTLTTKIVDEELVGHEVRIQATYTAWAKMAGKYPQWMGLAGKKERVKTVEVKPEPGLVKNQPYVQTWDEAEYEWGAKPQIEISGISNKFGTFEAPCRENNWTWTSGKFSMPKDLVAKKRKNIRKEIFHYFSYGSCRWDESKVGLDLHTPFSYQQGSRWQKGNVRGTDIPMRTQKRHCWVCQERTYHARDNLKVEAMLTYRCKKHGYSEQPSGFWGKSGELKCVCCGKIAATIVIPMVVVLGDWTFHVNCYGRFAEEAFALLQARHYIEGHNVSSHVKLGRDNRFHHVKSAWTRLMEVHAPQAISHQYSEVI